MFSLDRPHSPSSIDFMVEERGGTSSALELQPDRIGRGKVEDKDEKLEALARENSLMRAKNAYLNSCINQAKSEAESKDRKIVQLAREKSHIQAENGYLRGHREASKTFQRECESVYARHEKNMQLHIDRNFGSIEDIPRNLTDSYTTILNQLLDSLRRGLQDASINHATNIRILENKWLELVENKI